MSTVEAKPLLDFPDDPLKWEGWSNYKSDNPYAVLCLDPRARPADEEIEQHCTALLQWWQKKLRLKNQPSNPMTQLLGRGIDEASRYLVQARLELLDPARRLQVDEQLAAQAEAEALGEFSKYVEFSIARRVLTAEAEANLAEYGERIGLTEEQTRACIEEELQRNKAKRVAAPAPAIAEAPPIPVASPEAETEFSRILRLSDLALGDATKPVRMIFANIAENLGIHSERAEQLLDDFLDLAEFNPVAPRPAPLPFVRVVPAVPANKASAPQRFEPVPATPALAASPSEFTSTIGAQMVLIPAGEFLMGSNAVDAAPDEQPLTPVTLSPFYLARHPVTNAQYEQFDPSHRQKRMKGAAGDHPVVYVTSLEAVKYCQWLRLKDGKNYRLPTEAEWEYAARGSDGRKFPWANQERRTDLANFADASTTFAWRDEHVADGFPETSPVGAFPRGASFFGLEDMAGNVWEWCLDFYQALPGAPKRNPRGGTSGLKRVYRGGSWKSRFSNLRATARGANASSYTCNDVGFRIACECGGGDANGGADSNAG